MLDTIDIPKVTSRSQTKGKKTGANNETSITTNIVTITPEIAESWLSKNVLNRKVKLKAVAQYARDMSNGRWKLTGDCIRFDNQKNLIDGQHRLLACVKAGVAFDSFVIYGLQNETQSIIDAGVPRSAADMLSMSGVHNAQKVAAIAKIILLEKFGRAEASSRMSHSEIADCLKKHPSMPGYVIAGGTIPRGIPYTTISYIYYVGAVALNERDRAVAMFEVMKSGIPDYDGDPFHLYREKALRTNDNTLKVSTALHFNTIKYCWNLFVKKESINVLRWQKERVEIDGLNLNKL